MRSRSRKIVSAVAFATLLFGQFLLGQTAAEAGFLLSGHDATAASSDLSATSRVDAVRFASSQDLAGPAESETDAPEEPPVEVSRKRVAYIGASPLTSGGMNAPASSTADYAPIGAVVTPVVLIGPQESRWVQAHESGAAPVCFGSSILRPPRCVS